MKEIVLPIAPSPVGNYKAVVVRNHMGMVSGQFPIADGHLMYPGLIGRDVSIDEASEAMRLAALNVLAQISDHTSGFENLDGMLRIEAYLACTDSFFEQPSIIDVASDLFISTLGDDKGAHSRTAISVHQLPLNACIELVASFSEKK